MGKDSNMPLVSIHSRRGRRRLPEGSRTNAKRKGDTPPLPHPEIGQGESTLLGMDERDGRGSSLCMVALSHLLLRSGTCLGGSTEGPDSVSATPSRGLRRGGAAIPRIFRRRRD